MHIRQHPWLLALCFAAFYSINFGSVTSLLADEPLTVSDDRLRVKLFAQDPDIVTPIGMAIDEEDRVFVIESHTHLPAADYAGPRSDRIKLFVDADLDGTPESISIFADGLSQSMNLAFSPDGALYVVTARSVVRLDDLDKDGKAEKKTTILELLTTERYAHNSLLSLTFDSLGNLYVGRGNTGSRYYKLQGSDGSYVEGYGDGGSVIACKADGSDVREVATGFWNPFDLKFDMDGNLLLVDNDPDARGPNRLIKIVQGGDYGYKSVYGGAGNHPFQGWDGALPGTLPYIEGTGEAPSGLIDLRRSSFPKDYKSSVVATIWNENTIECFDLDRSQASITCRKKSVLVKGGKDFRPVALECDSQGNLYITDWVLVDYPNHGRGRIWRISSKTNSQSLSPTGYFANSSPATTLTQEARELSAQQITKRLLVDDPFELHAARMALSTPGHRELRNAFFKSEVDSLQLSAALAANIAGDDLDYLKSLLAHPNEDIRVTALMLAAESHDLDFAPHLDQVLESQTGVTDRVARAWLAANEVLNSRFVEAYKNRLEGRSNELLRKAPEGTIWKLAGNPNVAAASRATGIRMLSNESVASHSDDLLQLVQEAKPILSVAALERLLATDDPKLKHEAHKAALELAGDTGTDSQLRCAMLDALCASSLESVDVVAKLVESSDAEISLAAATLLQANAQNQTSKDAIEKLLNLNLPNRTLEQLSFAKYGLSPKVNTFAKNRPTSQDDWGKAIGFGGNPLRGKRVFESARTGCSGCHSLGGVEDQLGPDLEGLSQSKTREQVIASILDPSKDFAPQYQAWIVITVDGQIFRGLQLDHKAGGAIVMTLADGKKKRFEADDIDDYQASPSSLMPSGLQETMTVSEFRDLIAYIMKPE